MRERNNFVYTYRDDRKLKISRAIFKLFFQFFCNTIIIPFESIKKEKREEEASSNLFWEKCWRQNSHIIYFNTRTTRTAALYSLYSNTYGTSQVMDVWKITQINFIFKGILFLSGFFTFSTQIFFYGILSNIPISRNFSYF